MTDVLAETNGVKQVICISWGTKYGAPFINRLYASVKRNITPPFTFTCFTDSREGLNPEILCEDLPPLGIENMPTGTMGIWQKSRLWGESLGSLRGPVLFLDLDLVITGSLDDFFTIGKADDIVLARNQTTPFERLGQTSVFRFPVGKLVPIQEKFRANPQAIADQYNFEQRYVTRNAPGGIKFFPRRHVLHFKQDCRWPFPLNYFLAPSLPSNARIVLFPRGFHPEKAAQGIFSFNTEALSPLSHLMAVFDKKKRPRKSAWKHLRHFILPTPWINDHWRE